MVPAYGTVLVGKDPNADVASGAIFGKFLYVNNARYSGFPGGDTQYWVTTPKLRP
jgi:hypothetical protein